MSSFVEVRCPTCGELVNLSDIGCEQIDHELYDKTGQEVWLKPSNPNQCKWCEWGSEA